MPFDLQAHRGGLGLTVENTLPAFARALEVGVSTLEFDVQITRDRHVVVAHDSDPRPGSCLDTGPAYPGDPLYPYVRDATCLVELTLAQVRTIDNGSLRHPDHPEQQLAPGARIPLLTEVLDLVREREAEVDLDIEFKVDATVPGRTAPRETFVERVVPLLAEAGVLHRTTIESFDWRALMLVREAEPRLAVLALADGRHFGDAEQATTWSGGVEVADIAGYVAAATSLGAAAVGPDHALVSPRLVAEAHAAGLRVVPWTVDAPTRLRELIGYGVDGVITNRPDVARQVMEELGLPLPRAYPDRSAAAM